MGDSWRVWDRPGDGDLNDYTWSSDCYNQDCQYPDPHEHGFACDRTCACRTEQHLWRERGPRK